MGGSERYQIIQNIAVEFIGPVFFAPFLDFEKPVGNLRLDFRVAHTFHQVVVNVLKLLVGPYVELVVVVIVHLVDEGFETGEERRQDNAGRVLHLPGKRETFRQTIAGRRFPVMHHQRYPRVLEGFDSSCHSQGNRHVVVKIDTVFIFEIEIPQLAGQLNHVFGAGNFDQARISVGLLEHPGNVHVDDSLFFLRGKRLDEIVTVENPVEVVVIEYLAAGAGQPDGYTRNHDFLHAKIEFLNLAQGGFVLLFQKLPVGHLLQGGFVGLQECLKIF